MKRSVDREEFAAQRRDVAARVPAFPEWLEPPTLASCFLTRCNGALYRVGVEDTSDGPAAVLDRWPDADLDTILNTGHEFVDGAVGAEWVYDERLPSMADARRRADEVRKDLLKYVLVFDEASDL